MDNDIIVQHRLSLKHHMTGYFIRQNSVRTIKNCTAIRDILQEIEFLLTYLSPIYMRSRCPQYSHAPKARDILYSTTCIVNTQSGPAIPNVWFQRPPTYRSRDAVHAQCQFHWQKWHMHITFTIYLSYNQPRGTKFGG